MITKIVSFFLFCIVFLIEISTQNDSKDQGVLQLSDHQFAKLSSGLSLVWAKNDECLITKRIVRYKHVNGMQPYDVLFKFPTINELKAINYPTKLTVKKPMRTFSKFFSVYCYQALDTLDSKQYALVIESMFYNLKNLEKDWSSYEVIENNNCPYFHAILDPQEKKPTAFNVSSVIQLHNFFRDFQVLYTNWRRNIPSEIISNADINPNNTQNSELIAEIRIKNLEIERSEKYKNIKRFLKTDLRMIRGLMMTNNCLVRDLMTFYGMTSRFVGILKSKKTSKNLKVRLIEIVERFTLWKEKLNAISVLLYKIEFIVYLFKHMMNYNKISERKLSKMNLDTADEKSDEVIVLLTRVMAKFFDNSALLVQNFDKVMSNLKIYYFDIGRSILKIEISLNQGPGTPFEWNFKNLSKLKLLKVVLLSFMIFWFV